jgi:uncharacterized membrane protein YhaH (DUF805 family)
VIFVIILKNIKGLKTMKFKEILEFMVRPYKKTFDYKTKAKRSEFWYTHFSLIFVSIIFVIGSGFIPMIFGLKDMKVIFLISSISIVLFSIWYILVFLAVASRRINDIGKTKLPIYIYLVGLVIMFIANMIKSKMFIYLGFGITELAILTIFIYGFLKSKEV